MSESRLGAVKGPGVYARGRVMVAERGAVWPDRCIRCNAAAGGRRVRVNLFWVDAEDRRRARLLMLVPRVGGLLRWRHLHREGERATVEVGLCGRHRVLRAVSPVAVVVGVAGMVAVPWLTFDRSTVSPLPLLGGFAALFAGILLAAWGRRTARAHHIDAGGVTLTGAGEAFVRSLPMDPRPGAVAAGAVRLAGVRKR